MKRRLAALWFLTPLVALHAADHPPSVIPAPEKTRHLSARQVFDQGHPVIFQTNFTSNPLDNWELSEDDRYRLDQADPARLAVVDAPGLGSGHKAVRFAVPRAPNSFRAEISLPFEKGFNERWYGERMLIPEDWMFDPGKGNDIVMQWHAIPGNGKPTYPNLEISIGKNHWFIRRSFGAAHPTPTRTNQKLDDEVRRGVWLTWVIHAKWSPGADGLLQIWKDGKQVADLKGPNVYSTIGEDYTPYLKTGIYHPEWHLDTDRKREAFAKDTPVATQKVVYVTDVKIGNEKAALEDIMPKP